MKTIGSIPQSMTTSVCPESEAAARPLVSVIVPAFNESAIVQESLGALCQYLKSHEEQYRWEILVVNDGSSDRTGELAELFARSRPNVHVIHHPVNFGLGQALKSGINQSRGDYVAVLDMDLSYAPHHIEVLLEKIQETRAKIVVASPYSKGGTVSNVPWLRRTLSRWANRFLAVAAKCSLSTLTGMVRVYDGRFVRALNLKSMGMEVNPEIIYKGMLQRARIEEVPAHLDWRLQRTVGPRRRSSMKMVRHVMSTLLSGFIFRPFMFFILPGLALLLFALYVNTWMVIHFFTYYQSFSQYDWFLSRASAAVATAYQAFPHTFLVGGLALMLSIQLISLGVLSLQSKHYFEEMFHLCSSIFRRAKDQEEQTRRTKEIA